MRLMTYVEVHNQTFGADLFRCRRFQLIRTTVFNKTISIVNMYMYVGIF